MNEKKENGPLQEMQTLPQATIESRIITLRKAQVILDTDIAELYGIKTKRLNEQVQRNVARFPADFMFQLNKQEFDYLRSQIATANWSKRRSLPFAFTELGVSMLSSVLSSEIAIQVNIQIMRAFATMRHYFAANAQIFQRLDQMEYKQMETDNRIEQLFDKLEERSVVPKQNIFYDGQVFDAYQFVSGLIKSAEFRIVLIDNYVDESVLTLLDKRAATVPATVYTREISPQFKLDIKKHNAQYDPIEVYSFNKAHDRFLIIDDKVYHIGASLKDLGKKWFAFSLMLDLTPGDLLSRIR